MAMPGRRPRDMGPPAYLRAAIAYADLTQETIENELGVSASKLNRWLSGPSKPDYKAPEPSDLEQVSKLTGFPLRFLIAGFDQEDLEQPELAPDARPSDVEKRMAELAERVGALETDVPGKLERIAAALEMQTSKPAASRGTVEQLADQMRAMATEIEERFNQQGRDTGKRDLQRRRGPDLGRQGQQGAA